MEANIPYMDPMGMQNTTHKWDVLSEKLTDPPKNGWLL